MVNDVIYLLRHANRLIDVIKRYKDKLELPDLPDQTRRVLTGSIKQYEVEFNTSINNALSLFDQCNAAERQQLQARVNEIINYSQPMKVG